MWKERVNKTLVRLTGYQLQRPTAAAYRPRTARTRKSGSPMTIAQGWDAYAKQRRGAKGVGDVWNNPRRIGIAVERPEEVVPYLDKEVFEPFLGYSDVLLEIGPGGG